MSKNKTTKKRAVPTKATSSRRAGTQVLERREMVFGKENFKWMGIGLVLVALGMIAMLGGDMPSPDVWDEDIIYSFRITVIAPILILAGLIVEIYAIFKD